MIAETAATGSSDMLPLDRSRSSGRLDGKVAVVVGAGSSGPGWGNGKAAAALFAREGAKIACVDVKAEAARETVGIIRGRGGEAFAIEADVGAESSHEDIVAQTLERFGRIDVLHNNVGILRRGGLVDSALEDWDATLAVNLTGAYKMCRAVMPALLEGRGNIIFVSSIAAIRYLGVAQLAYSVSKAGLLQLTQALALEYASRGVRVNSVLPGLMNTPMIVEPIKGAANDSDLDEALARRDALCPMGYMGDAWDVAHAALFLACDESKYITAASIVVDGGITARCAVV